MQLLLHTFGNIGEGYSQDTLAVFWMPATVVAILLGSATVSPGVLEWEIASRFPNTLVLPLACMQPLFAQSS